MDSTQEGFRASPEDQPSIAPCHKAIRGCSRGLRGNCLLPPRTDISDLAFQTFAFMGEQPRTLWRLEPVFSATPIPVHTAQPPRPMVGERPSSQLAAQRLTPNPTP